MTRRLEPTVTSPSGKRRLGKGFSLAELSSAGLSLDLAHRMHLPVDKRRSSSREENIMAIKGLLPSAEPAKKIEEKPAEPKLRAEKKEPITTKTVEEIDVKEIKTSKRKRAPVPSKPVEEIDVKEIKTSKRKRAPVPSKPAEEPKLAAEPIKPKERKSSTKRRKSGSSEAKE
ncbi:hypothetical protein A3K70_01045 [Candidatus Bathyarchaeota archaeon RBG_16_48_13]|nr:MAG: hypothetical protein A3K70_01045 [Candidatus Bathyarchaeota archaeon RBG_16_48_13]